MGEMLERLQAERTRFWREYNEPPAAWIMDLPAYHALMADPELNMGAVNWQPMGETAVKLYGASILVDYRQPRETRLLTRKEAAEALSERHVKAATRF